MQQLVRHTMALALMAANAAMILPPSGHAAPPPSRPASMPLCRYAALPPSRHAAAVDTGRVRLVVAAGGNEARYRVREQLAGVEFPNDAVGVTSAITGAIVLDGDGQVVPAESKLVVDLTTLKSDRDRRDRFIQRRTLETEQYPTVELVPTELRGLTWPLPTAGAFEFHLIGDLTVHGVTRPTTWRVTATTADGAFRGSAVTSFAFEEFGLTQPRVAVVLSVDDKIQLEYHFHLVRDSQAGK
jgi:polyisoprenoid-binding protein YceI